jgi:uncharacterized protein YbaP (TraB family)
MMTRTFFSILCSLLAISAWAQPASARYAPSAEDKALLWTISGKGMEAPSYLYGTIHMIGAEDYFLTESAKKSFESVKHVAFEIDMQEMTDMSKMMPLMMKAFMAGDTTLSDLLTEEEYALVKESMESAGLPMMFAERIKPMFLSAIAGGGEDMMGMQPGSGSSSIKSYEMEFMQMAEQRSMEIDGLETAEFQMGLFDSIPYRVQADMLVEALKAGGDEGDDQFAEMVRLYKDQDIYAMQTLMDEDGGIKGYEDLLLVSRNRNWIPVMEEMMGKRPTFFAVGAGHLAGDEGVIALLREAGYKVTPVKE